MTDAAHRLWRLRKQHQSIDADLTVARGDAARSPRAGDAQGSGVGESGSVGPEVVLQFVLSGEVVYSRRWATRTLALEDAAARRAALEREGWMPHW